MQEKSLFTIFDANAKGKDLKSPNYIQQRPAKTDTSRIHRYTKFCRLAPTQYLLVSRFNAVSGTHFVIYIRMAAICNRVSLRFQRELFYSTSKGINATK